jgi:hypothetical protein
MDKSRKLDIQNLKKDLASNPNPLKRKKILEAGEAIRKEQLDGWKRSARQSLLRESGKNAENAKDISDDIIKHEKMGIGRTTFGFNISEERWNEIFKK